MVKVHDKNLIPNAIGSRITMSWESFEVQLGRKVVSNGRSVLGLAAIQKEWRSRLAWWKPRWLYKLTFIMLI